jgi:hypothetical protein
MGLIREMWAELVGWTRRFRVRHDLYREEPDRHPALKLCQVGELLPWKGTHWRVASIRELPFPCVILTPGRETVASQVHGLQAMRRADRILTKDEQTVRASLEKRAGA